MFCLAVSGVFADSGNKIELISEAYGSSLGSARWNPEADLNGDGIVNIYDLALASKGDIVSSQSTYGPLEGGTTLMAVNPENTFIDLVGKSFSVNINVTDALPTYAFEFKLSWSPSLLTVISINYGTFLTQRGAVSCAQDDHFAEGWIMFGCTLLEPTVPQTNNNGNLAIINFNTLNKGETPLHLYDTHLLDDSLNDYTHTNNSGNAIVGIIDIISPENTTYHTKVINLNYTTKIVPSWTGYSLDGQANVSITGNTTLYCLANTTHNIVMYESDAFGNTFSSDKVYFTIDVLAGDVNGDCIVDTFDLSQLGKAWGSTPTSPNWDPYADLKCDGFIEIFDLFLVGRNFGSSKSCPPTGFSSPVTTLYVEPEMTSFSNAINTTFNVNVSLDDVNNLYAYEFKLKYDPNVLTATNLAYSFLNKPTWVGIKKIDNTKGEINLGITSWTGALPKTGKGAIATVTFQVKDFGNTELNLYGTKLADYSIKLIGHDVEDGFFNNYIPAIVDIDPNTLNLKDKGKWMTAYIKLNGFVCGNDECEVELGEDASNCPTDCPVLPPAPSGSLSASDVININISTVKLWYNDNYVPAASGEIINNTMVAKFDKSALQSLLAPSESVELTVTGETLYNSRYVDFKGTDAIRIISK